MRRIPPAACSSAPGIRSQNDRFRHVNGRWLARTEIPTDLASYGLLRILAEQAEDAVHGMVEEAASAPQGGEERKLGDLNASFMDADRAEQLGSRSISLTLAAAQASSVRDGFAGHVQRMLELAGLPDADLAASRVLALETAVAGHHWSTVASRDSEMTYNLFDKMPPDIYPKRSARRTDPSKRGKLKFS